MIIFSNSCFCIAFNHKLLEDIVCYIAPVCFTVLKALFDVHDRVASKEYLPTLPDLLPQCDDEDQAVKIVKLIKNNEPLVMLSLLLLLGSARPGSNSNACNIRLL